MPFQLWPLIEPQFAPAAQTALYTSPGSSYSRIDSMSIVNTDTVSHTISINIIPSAGAAAASNLTTDAQAIQPKQTWNSPNEIGKVLAPGDSISVIASTASVLAIACSGIVQS